MKISEIITDKYKLRIPPTVYYDLLADVVEAEKKQEHIFGKIRAEIPTVEAIPNNLTNADVFSLIYGYYPATDELICNNADWCGLTPQCSYCTANRDCIGTERDWWNSPYKKPDM